MGGYSVVRECWLGRWKTQEGTLPHWQVRQSGAIATEGRTKIFACCPIPSPSSMPPPIRAGRDPRPYSDTAPPGHTDTPIGFLEFLEGRQHWRGHVLSHGPYYKNIYMSVERGWWRTKFLLTRRLSWEDSLLICDCQTELRDEWLHQEGFNHIYVPCHYLS